MAFSRLTDRSIRSKMMWIIMTTVMSSIVLLGLVFVSYEYYSQRNNMTQEYATTVQIVAQRSEAALLFQDLAGLQENLNSLKVKREIEIACLYDKEIVLADYKAEGNLGACAERPNEPWRIFGTRQYWHSEAIVVDGVEEGMILVQVSLDGLYRQLGFYVLMVLVVGLIVGSLAFLVSRFLQEVIARPLVNLAETARTISTTQNYELSAERESDDEIGELVDAFNSMLVTIKAQNERITQNAQELDMKVKSRTKELDQSNRELAVANKELEAFSYSVSHDLRSPLRAIDGFTRALEEDYAEELDDLARSYIERARGAAQKMGELISTLLQLSRVSRKELDIQACDLSMLAKEVSQRLKDAEPERDVVFTVAPDLTVSADTMLMEVALNNLLGNAWKYSGREAQAVIEMGCKVIGEARVYFIKDNGAGFDKTYASDLFSAFKRLHTDDEFEGTGIGLATVARVIHRHHGDIWATSEIDEGACFYFTLNEPRPDDQDSHAQSSSEDFHGQ